MKMNKNIGFIGCGNMAQAIIGGIVKSGLINSKNIMASNRSYEKLKSTEEKYGILTAKSNDEVARFSDLLFLSVKPNVYKKVIEEIKDEIKKDVVIVTIAAGVDIKSVEGWFEKKLPIIRTMPNTSAQVGESMTAVCVNDVVKEEDLSFTLDIFKSLGKAEIVDEKLMDAVVGVSGSSGAYVYMFIEALADGAVLSGMTRKMAYEFAAQSVLGAAKMVLETGQHPGILKDNVCSPAGTTIDAVYSLEKNNFRGTVIEAVKKCTEKSIEMSKRV